MMINDDLIVLNMLYVQHCCFFFLDDDPDNLFDSTCSFLMGWSRHPLMDIYIYISLKPILTVIAFVCLFFGILFSWRLMSLIHQWSLHLLVVTHSHLSCLIMRTRLGEQFGPITELTIALNVFFRHVLMASDREMQGNFHIMLTSCNIRPWIWYIDKMMLPPIPSLSHGSQWYWNADPQWGAHKHIQACLKPARRKEADLAMLAHPELCSPSHFWVMGHR